MNKFLLIFLFAFSLVSSQGFEVSDSKLYVQDGSGTVVLTPLQGAHIVGDGSASVSMTAVNLPVSNTFGIEFRMWNDAQVIEVLFSSSTGAGDTRFYSQSDDFVFYDDDGNNTASTGDIAKRDSKWYTYKVVYNGADSLIFTRDGGAREAKAVTFTNVNIDVLFANYNQTGSILTKKIAWVKITKNSVLTNHWLPTPNIDSDRNPTVLFDIVGGNHATWTGATLADIGERSNAVRAPENEIGYNWYQINSLTSAVQGGAVLTANKDTDSTYIPVPNNYLDTSVDAYGNTALYNGVIKRSGQVKAGQVATWDGSAQLEFSTLSGITIAESQGTSTPSVDADTIEFTAGTCWELLLSNGARFPMCEGDSTIIHDVNPGTATNGTLTGATFPDFWAGSSDDDSALYVIRHGWNDLAGDGSLMQPANTYGHIPGTTSTVSNPSGDWFNGGTDSTTVIDWNPYDLKEINDSYAAGSNSWGVNDYAYGDTLDGTYFQNTISTNYESIFFIYDTDGTTVLGKYLYDTSTGGKGRKSRVGRVSRIN